MIADRKPTFYNLANTRNEQLMKETGLLAWGMKEYYGYDSFLATYENGDYLNLKYLPGLRMEFIPRRTGRFLPDSLLWLMKNAKRIDVLYIFHAIMSSFLRAYVYKLFNPRGKVYVKLDGWPSPNQGKPWKRPFYRWLMKHADCVSTELEENAELLSRKWGRRVICVPKPSKPNELQPFRPFSERSNTILTVGR
ncbi:MAG: hypothetical protein II917_09850, partial [Synergistaceae bacterium]|nr:hypothetical protein [Synergistaceae bacterium]